MGIIFGVYNVWKVCVDIEISSRVYNMWKVCVDMEISFGVYKLFILKDLLI